MEVDRAKEAQVQEVATKRRIKTKVRASVWKFVCAMKDRTWDI